MDRHIRALLGLAKLLRQNRFHRRLHKVSYLEHLQGFHYAKTVWSSRNIGVPVLLDDGRVIVDSTAILKHLDNYAPAAMRLYPENADERRRVEELEDLFDDILGVESRRWVYFHLLPDAKTALKVASQGVPALERALAPLLYPFMRRFATWRMQVSASNVATGLERLRQIMRQTDALLADGRPYLIGESFSAADLALACMLAPLVVPEEYGVRLPPVDDFPPAMRANVVEFRRTATGQYVLKLFRDLRRAHASAE